MKIVNKNIDHGKSFDWGLTSKDYAKYRDIYPNIFYNKIIERNLCIEGQNVLDIGTGTGVLPRNLYKYGANWTGIDISENQIQEAEALSQMGCEKIKYIVGSLEALQFEDNQFDVVTACQCFWYFDYDIVIPKLSSILKENGTLLILQMAWLPNEDKIAEESEKIVLKYNPYWNGAGEVRKNISVPERIYDNFEKVSSELFDVKIPFTRETWNGRIKACRGVGASLSNKELIQWEQEHREFLQKNAPSTFEILHYVSILELKNRKNGV